MRLINLFCFKFWIGLCFISAVLMGCAVSNSTGNGKLLAPAKASVAHHTLVIEAERFATQHLDDKRRWLVFDQKSQPHHYADGDLMHYQNASAGQYIEILPDTRVNHSEPLVRGENFSDIPGKVAILSYPVYFKQAGTYIVWARAFSTGSEDNGVHIGINGTWPATSQRLQLCQNKHQWTWSSAQRTTQNHCGVPKTITIDVPSAGVHNVMVSMREDGFELDKLLLTTDPTYQPQGIDKMEMINAPVSLPEKQDFRALKQYKKIIRATEDFTFEPASEGQKPTVFEAHYTIQKKDAGKHPLSFVALSQAKQDVIYYVKHNNTILAVFSVPKAKIENQALYFDIAPVVLNKGDVLQVLVDTAVAVNAINNNDLTKPEHLWKALVIMP